MKKLLCTMVALGGMIAALPACSTEPKTAAEKSTLSANTDAALVSFKNADPSLAEVLNKSAGYVVFPEVGKAGFVIGGANGRGELYQNGVKVGYADISQATIGLQAGAQTFSELIVFLTSEQLEKFKTGKFEFAANVSAVAAKAGAAATADYSKGAVAFTQTKGGLMAEAAIGGQKFNYKPY